MVVSLKYQGSNTGNTLNHVSHPHPHLLSCYQAVLNAMLTSWYVFSISILAAQWIGS